MTATDYGTLDITINLSKPEKDPKAIAAAKSAPQSGYPKCQLCMENEGYFLSKFFAYQHKTKRVGWVGVTKSGRGNQFAGISGSVRESGDRENHMPGLNLTAGGGFQNKKS